MVMGIVVLGTAMGFYLVTVDSQDAGGQRAELTRDVRTAMNRMDGEIRQATEATVVNSQVIDLQTTVVPSGGGAKALAHVRYDCSIAGVSGTYTCTRDTGPYHGGLSGTPTELLKNVINTDVFSVGSGTAASPSLVNLKINASFKSLNNGDPSQHLQLQDGVALRNLPLP